MQVSVLIEVPDMVKISHNALAGIAQAMLLYANNQLHDMVFCYFNKRHEFVNDLKNNLFNKEYIAYIV